MGRGYLRGRFAIFFYSPLLATLLQQLHVLYTWIFMMLLCVCMDVCMGWYVYLHIHLFSVFLAILYMSVDNNATQ